MKIPLLPLVVACALLAASAEGESHPTAVPASAPSARPGALPGAVAGFPTPGGQCAGVQRGQEQSGQAELSGKDWILKAADNICGLRDASQLTHPAVIDFEACLDATPEMMRIRDQGIDPKSAEGIQLRTAAVTRLTDACEAVRGANSHCSVWKKIRHRDGRAIPDISSQVIALF